MYQPLHCLAGQRRVAERDRGRNSGMFSQRQHLLGCCRLLSQVAEPPRLLQEALEPFHDQAYQRVVGQQGQL